MIDELKQYGCDTQGAIERMLNSEAMYKKFLLKFLNDKTFSEVKPNIDAKDYDEALKSVHTLKGVCGNLGLAPLFDISADMVSRFRANDPEGAVALYVELERVYNDIVSLIHE